MSRGRVIFDGDCGFCTWCAGRIIRWVDADVDVLPWQDSDLASMGLSPQQCVDAVQWISAGGDRQSGARAVAAVLLVGRQPWRACGAIIDAPAMRRPAQAAYRFVARHRHRLWGATPACAMTGQSTTPS